MSPIHSDSSFASKENRHGLRRPHAQISGRATVLRANGLSLGMQYWRPPHSRVTSIRTIFPSSVLRFCAPYRGSSALPPSPVLQYRYPSGPNWRSPPLWLPKRLCCCRSTSSSEPGSTDVSSALSSSNLESVSAPLSTPVP